MNRCLKAKKAKKRVTKKGTRVHRKKVRKSRRRNDGDSAWGGKRIKRVFSNLNGGGPKRGPSAKTTEDRQHTKMGR